MGKKATFMLDEAIVEQAKGAIKKGLFKSMNSFVETAMRDELERIKRAQIKAAIMEAGKDPLFLSDIKEMENDFRYVDFEEAEE